MNIVYKKLISKILKNCVTTTIALVLCVIIVQSSRFTYLVSNSNTTIPGMIHLISYLSIDMIANILPISIGLSVAITLYRFKESKQLVALQSLGNPIKNIQIPIIASAGIITAILYFLTIYLSPISLENFKTMELQLMNNISLPKHSGNIANYKGISVYAESYHRNMKFKNIIITDNRINEIHRTYCAEFGALANKIIHLENGKIIEYRKDDKKLSVTQFAEHTYDLSEIAEKFNLKLRPHEMKTSELANSNLISHLSELHSRLTIPLLAILISLVSFLCICSGKYSRKTSEKPIIKALASIIIIEVIYLFISNSTLKNVNFIHIQYVFILLGILITILIINVRLNR